ncbi:SpoIID/LytB domain-containing protein [Peptoniphilus mikwangii]|uniref:SpoIID/LytB domain-containing protein n=1 Tax=Peptoniphilus mikwangii TaxID=1354300 RepID=UPI0003FDB5FB|nr:SpoIID/LytB domain-containing protein [Peptoniphilus mikwangii]
MKKNFLVILIMLLLTPFSVYAEDDTYFNIKIGKTYTEGSEINVTSKSNIYLVDADYNKIIDLNSKTVTAVLKSGKIILKNKEQIYSNDLVQDGAMMLATDDYLKVNNEYRGYIYFKNLKGNLIVINHIKLEDYLKGVVPKELSAEYPIEALKAQAICSRGFALKNINKYKKLGYNLDDTTNSQVYSGKSCEKDKSNRAVDETNGVYATFEGKVADTIFGASSGGCTADIKDVWGGNGLSYLTVIEDPYSLKYTWNYSLDKSKMTDMLKNNSINIGELLSINITDYDNSGRIKKVDLIGSNSTVNITGNKFRNIFGNTKIKSALFTVSDLGSSFKFDGKGYGHGVGMSQYGAVEMAKEGKSYREIIHFYFPGVELNK